MGVKTHTPLLFESTVKDFNTIFNNKLNRKVNLLKKDTSKSVDEKIRELQNKIEKYFDGIVNKVNTYYSPIFKSVEANINNMNYKDILDYIENIEVVLYDNLMIKISKDKSLKLEDIGFNEKSLFSDLNSVFLWTIEKVLEKLKKEEVALKENNSSMKTVFNKYKTLPDTIQNLTALRSDAITYLPESIKNAINGVLTNCQTLKKEYIEPETLKTLF